MKDIFNEMDYRNIPRDMLDKNIPTGRGMVKWAPFATLPEQFETIYQYMIDQNKVSRPVLSDDQLSSINYEIEGTAPHSRERHKVSFLDIIDISFI
ncbi:MAG: YolD-like family protein [Staphylococcus epidermidis]|nr:YolD-like family protein [Staphylococcus epidermidis]